MNALLVILFILFVCVTTGHGAILLLARFDQHFLPDRLEIWYIALLVGLLINSWAAFILVELGQFSVFYVGAFALFSELAGQFVNRRSKNPISLFKALQSQVHWEIGSLQYLPISLETICILGWLIISLGLFFRPHQPIWGAADAGVYINYAAHIAETGGVILNEPLLADIPSNLYPNFLGQSPDTAVSWSFLTPSLDVNEMTGRIYFSFYHLHPTWQAVGWQIGGVIGGLFVTPLWGLLSTLGFYFLLRHLLKPKSFALALIGLAALTLSALQVWFVRYGTTEPLTQLLFMFGFLAFCHWDKSRYSSWLWGGLAGAAFGLTFLVRIDTFFIGLIPAVLLLLILLKKFKWGDLAIFLTPLLALAIHGTLHAAQFSPEYVSRLINYMWIVATGPGLVTVTVILACGIVLALATWLFKDIVTGLFSPFKRALALAVAAYFLYGWFVRPYTGVAFSYSLNGVQVESWNHENLIRLGWYLMPAGVFAAFAGIIHLILKRKWNTWFILLPCLFYTLFYTWDLRSNGVQIYVMRRYIPIVLPFMLYASISLWEWLLTQRFFFAKQLTYTLITVWFVGLLWGARGFVSRVDYRGVHHQIVEIADAIPANSIILFNQPSAIGVGDHLALPLRFMHGHKPFVLRNVDENSAISLKQLIDDWLAQGESVVWIDLPPHTAVTILGEFEQIGVYPVRLQSDVLESVYTQKPTEIFPVIWEFQMIELK